MKDLFELIEYTNRCIFLTGRAGTGKTTFLQDFVRRTSKKFVIVAPTGIAAINAGGVTIHSMFGLPLSTFVPTTDFVDRNIAINIPNLLPHFKFRRDKLRVLQALEILIIDEVSMLRCDVLDMLDQALRSARRTPLPFGGVQVLFIGDLFQLPPVVKAEAEETLLSYYRSPFFFEARALVNNPPLTVALTKVYRQTDPVFLGLLNAIRDNDPDGIDFNLLHSRYLPDFDTDEFYVHLVSHNYIADAVNKKKLQQLPGKERKYRANIWGEFKPHLYPNEEELALKEGAQVMFIRNDIREDKRFYNGKLATIVALSDGEVKVQPQDGALPFSIERETWENKKYYVDNDNSIAEDVVGSYEQFPFKLAWAVTIHKSQGLTFDKVIIDAGQSFTSGQVYVALSRCRTLEGIVLKTRILPHAIINDPRINAFQLETDAGNNFTIIVEEERYGFLISRLMRKLSMQQLQDGHEDWVKAIEDSKVIDADSAHESADLVGIQLAGLAGVYEKFAAFVSARLPQLQGNAALWDTIEEKCAGAVNFFYKKVNEELLHVVLACYKEAKVKKGLKGYSTVLKKLIDTGEAYLASLKEIALLRGVLFDAGAHQPVGVPPDKVPTHIITYQMFDAGKTPKEIASERNLSEGTVFGHLAKIAGAGILDIERIIAPDRIKLFEDRFKKHKPASLTEWKNILPDFFDYNEIKVLLGHFNYKYSK